MKEEYQLRIIFNEKPIVIKTGTLKEIDEFTSGAGDFPGFENEEELLESKAFTSDNARVTIVCVETKGDVVSSHYVKGVAYKQDKVILDSLNLLMRFYSYQVPRTKENATFILALAEIYSTVPGFERLCDDIKTRLYTDYSNQYYRFLNMVKGQYNTMRNLYFLSKDIREICSNQNDKVIDEEIKRYLLRIVEKRKQKEQAKKAFNSDKKPARFIFPNDYDNEEEYRKVKDQGRHI